MAPHRAFESKTAQLETGDCRELQTLDGGSQIAEGRRTAALVGSYTAVSYPPFDHCRAVDRQDGVDTSG